MRALTWRDAAGVAYSLDYATSADRFAGAGVRVGGPPPVRATYDNIPFAAGSRLRHIVHDSRDVLVPIYIAGTTTAAVEAAADTLFRAMDPTRGDGTLEVTRDDGSVRVLPCRCVAWDGWAEETATDSLWVGVATLKAADPYWRGTTPITASLTQSAGSTSPYNSATRTYDQGTYDELAGWGSGGGTNPGNVASPIDFTFTGQFSAVQVLNQTSGQRFILSNTFTPSPTTVQVNGSTRTLVGGQFQYFQGDFVDAVPGGNTLQISFTVGTGVGGSMSFVPRYLSP